MTDEPLFDESATPSQNPDVDLESLSDPPSSNEFYLYSRIDGNQTVKQLCQTSGLGRQATLDGLERLVRVGLITMPGVDIEVDSPEPDEAAEPAGEPEEEEEPAGELGASGSDVMHRRPLGQTSSSVVSDEEEGDSVVEQSEASEVSEVSEASEASEVSEDLTGIDLTHLPIPPSEFDFDRELLERDIPMEPELKRELLCLAEQLDDLTHYQFFGVERDAEGGAIKKSYFMLSKRYHPDKHFRKEIGPFKQHLEKVFQKITRAYRTLSDESKREEYDRELAEREATGPTPMNQPSTVRMAHESANGSRPTLGKKSGEEKRSAAFAKLVRKAEKLRQEDEYVAAADSYRKALSLKQDLKVAIQAARVLLKAGVQIDQAELFARAALRIDQENTEARLLLGRALEKLGKPEKARDQYEQLLEIQPDHDKAIARRQALSSDEQTTSS